MAAVVFVLAWMTEPISAHVPGIVPPEAFWRTWSLEPVVLFTLVIMSCVYARGIRRLRSAPAGNTRVVSRARVWSFAAGLAAVALALI